MILLCQLMRSVNKVILIGNATRAAELRTTTTGKAVASLRIATNRTVRDQEETQFHTVVCWEKLWVLVTECPYSAEMDAEMMLRSSIPTDALTEMLSVALNSLVIVTAWDRVELLCPLSRVFQNPSGPTAFGSRFTDLYLT